CLPSVTLLTLLVDLIDILSGVPWLMSYGENTTPTVTLDMHAEGRQRKAPKE
ncbi:hypothetical protein BgiBS90_001629, partial [Biomphalaria glabrata]